MPGGRLLEGWSGPGFASLEARVELPQSLSKLLLVLLELFDVSLGVDLVMALLAFAEDADGIVCFAPIAWGGAVAF